MGCRAGALQPSGRGQLQRKGFQSGSPQPSSLSLPPYAGCCRCRLHPKAASLSTSPLPATPPTHHRHHPASASVAASCVSASPEREQPPPCPGCTASRGSPLPGTYPPRLEATQMSIGRGGAWIFRGFFACFLANSWWQDWFFYLRCFFFPVGFALMDEWRW